MGYYGANTLLLLSHIYRNYARIPATKLVENNKNLRDPCNPEEPLESLYTRLNQCVDYATSEGEPIT